MSPHAGSHAYHMRPWPSGRDVPGTGHMLPAAIGFVCLWFLLSACADTEKMQPIDYSHNVHIETAGLTCVDCHTGVETAVRATIPPTEFCSSCHSGEPIGQSAEEAKLITFVAKSAEVPWKKVYVVPDHVYFSHRRHVTGGQLDCQQCHGNVATFTSAVSRPFLAVTMENCMDCHRTMNVSNDCLSCHR